MLENTIERNMVRCAKCNDVIESKSRHDFVTCTCGAVSVDGGHDYSRLVGNPEDIILFIKGEEISAKLHWNITNDKR